MERSSLLTSLDEKKMKEPLLSSKLDHIRSQLILGQGDATNVEWRNKEIGGDPEMSLTPLLLKMTPDRHSPFLTDSYCLWDKQIYDI